MSQANLCLRVLQETKVMEKVYTRRYTGYSVFALDVPSRHCNGVAVFYRSDSQFSVEAPQLFGPNVISLHMTSGERRWYIVGLYLVPENA